ncbi:dipeptidyl aminopeptidase/acylaminoacyl peptidase [Ereboglobus sp. PH5-5]|uniref:alpha/beta hydrolase family protein n=1 Tax=Ereboglobus sp. PH5-5 TaxID=2940529 RepID=UPI002404982F|nr:alpha/beta fold hydrolase [Ereboglobus sp. PH5-5]MDF9831821.1 dipeptidyl aminopeptidase/acylaminoacyl peptidase [Ereboglobus sp. PH5-5]
MKIFPPLLVFVILLGSANAYAKPTVRVEDIFRKYERFTIKLSPDGKNMVSIFAHNRVKSQRDVFASYGLALISVDDRKAAKLHDADDVHVQYFTWVGNKRIMAWMTGGFKNEKRAIYAYDIDGEDFVELVPPLIKGNKKQSAAALLRWAKMIPSRTLWPDRVLMARRKTGDAYEERRSWKYAGMEPVPGVYQLNTKTGEIALVRRDPGRTMEWFADKQGVMRVASGHAPEDYDTKGLLKNPSQYPAGRVYWIDDDNSVRPMSGIVFGENENFLPMGFDYEGKKFLFSGRQGKDRAAIYAYLPESDTVEGPLIANENVDVETGILSPWDGTVAGIRYWDGKATTIWLDPHLSALQTEIDSVLPEFTNTFTSWSLDYQRLIIRSQSSQEPGRYYLFDQKTGHLEQIYRSAEWLNPKALGQTEPIQFKARDGLVIHGYITRPPGKTVGDCLPTVLLVHGGPWSVRDYDLFDPETQFFATRGYAVLRVNFRGSSGYGKRFSELSRKQMNLAMQTDIYDAIDWAVAQKYSNPDRLVIAGSSYGGYATLCALTGMPDKFKAGVAFIPVSDIFEQIAGYERRGRDGERAAFWWKEWVGDPKTDKDLLTAASPINFISRIKVPLFLMYGDKDDRIDYERQNKQLVARLRHFKIEFTLHAPEGEGHGIQMEANRAKVFNALETFLKKNAPAD